jgi:3-hydroxyacyl-[acyl-carrier-protein] dehydratase
MDQPFSLSAIEIQQYQRNRYPYLYVDRITEVVPGKYAKGFKNLTQNEWYFPAHFENHPNMPGMIQIESLAQVFIMTFLTFPEHKGKMTNFISADKVRFKKRILPGDRLDIETELKSFRRGMAKGTAKGYVDGELACSAEFVIALPDVVEKFTPMSKDGE